MCQVINNLEEKEIFRGNTNELLRFVDKIRIENGDFDYSILGISDAIEYIEDYCDNLELIELD
jgi:hypothetical protein